MKTTKAIFTLLIFLVIFCSDRTVFCNYDDSYAVPLKLVGMWTAIGTCEFISINFRDNGTFTADRGMDNLFSNLEGTYEVHGKTITLNVTNDPRVPAYAPQIKLRNYKVKNDILIFAMNGKKCKFKRSG